MNPGSRHRSQVCATEVIVVRATDGVLSCGGYPMVELGQPVDERLQLDPARAGGSLLGKRYSDAAGELEVLVTKAGDGSLHLGEEILDQKQAKALPSSD